MKKTYLVKKDPEISAQDNWIIMNGFEFRQFMQTDEGQSRKDCFGKMPALSPDEPITFIECGREMAREWDCSNKREKYRRERDERDGYKVLYYQHFKFDDDEDLSGEDILEDDSPSVEDSVVRKMKSADIRRAVMQLPNEERDFILCRFLDETVLTEAEYAENIHVSRDTVYNLKRRSFRHLRRLLKNFSDFDA